MSTNPLPSRAVPEATPEPTHQLYLTHCLYDEGITRPAGFAVRASSTRDPLLLRFAQEYPPYEAAGVADSPGADAEPRQRLALVRVPGGPKAIIHSVAIPGGRHGRSNAFFSHVLVRPRVTACEALRLWGSPDWAADCAPSAGKELDPAAAFEPGPLGDRAVTQFLSPDDAPAEGGSSFCPARFDSDAGRRRELLALTLRGCLRALREPAGSPRGRFFLAAEPRLAALLIYGAVRLLPPHFGQEVTFSTYERMGPSLRNYHHGRVVGTWSARPGRVLGEEFFTTKGYAFDTARRRCSPELREDHDPAIDDWLDLAAQGDWDLLDTVYRLLGDTATPVVSFQQGFHAAKLTQRLAKGKAEVADLIGLKHSPLGAALLDQHAEKVWPLVRDGVLPDAVLGDEFGDVLARHVPELERRVSEALRVGSLDEWRPDWRLLKAALREDPGRLRDCLKRILPPPPHSAALRFTLLTEFRALHALPLARQLPLHSLLRHCGPDELTRFSVSDLPREWYVWALFYALIKGEAQAEAVRQVDAGDDSLLRLFWEQFGSLEAEAQRRAILTPLFAPRGGKHVLLFGRSLAALAGVRAETVRWLLDRLGALGREWAEFWCAADHLARLVDVLRSLGDASGSLWDRLLAHLDADLLLHASPFQRVLLVNLAGANSRPGPPLPAKAAQAIVDHALLRDHFERACGVPASARPAILAACVRCKYDVAAVLRRYFERYVLPHEVSPRRTDDFVEFAHSFYPAGDDYQANASRLLGWRAIISACPEAAKRDAYSDRYLQRFVPFEFRDRLAQEILGRAGTRDELAAVGPPPVAPEKAAEAPAAPADFAAFQLSGVGAGSVVGALLKGSPALLVHFAGGLLAVAILGCLDIPPRQALLACTFVPLILALADGMALQSVALRLGTAARPALARDLAGGALAGACLGIAGAALAAGAGFLLGGGTARAVCVGGAVAAGMLSATVLGLTLPVLCGATRRRAPLAVGPIVRTVAGLLALGVYVLASRWLGH